ncbi:Phosphoglycerate dehydrogenase [Paenibacillus sp. UNCCL117]|uniref:hydroxyacid dehydrogenase n=1 Tax=unclassified Paenibacillus TaxID=185978 RepID=UPI000889FB22|nr:MULTISPECIES: hydroxyacid dehydrogenase [unclassified Paenibacillus]SDE44831.1 Phosphoglycerate dehydrogenase [Paenibacillus sp. cl123]SFW46370.1 Phosphoglycerate dehydrogenase [Paenibacillus sp. UNCCL117]
MSSLNIVMLQGKDLIDKFFKPEQLEQLRQFGTLRMNPKSGPPSKEEVAELIKDADIVITSWGNTTLDAELLDRCPNVKLIAHAAGTVKPVISTDVAERGIRVCSANDALAKGVAETTLGLAIVSLKNIWQLARSTREGEWDKGREHVRELYEVTIGVVGGGLSGGHFIRLLKQFDVRVLVYDPFLSEAAIRERGGDKVEFDTLLRESDVVSIHAPSIPETDHMFNQRTLKLMKDDAILINTARGSLIDEDALVAELRKGRLWACLDVTLPEPPDVNHPFRSLPNVTLIPHIAGATNNGLHRVAAYTIREIELFLKGQQLRGEVDLSVLHTRA